jgi:hypothetical protein
LDVIGSLAVNIQKKLLTNIHLLRLDIANLQTVILEVARMDVGEL